MSNKFHIVCPDCHQIVARSHWITKPFINDQGKLQGVYWCSICQKEFSFISDTPPENLSYTVDGYVLIKVPGRGYVRQHIYVWEQHNGKPLPEGYVIHHINGNKVDNRIENLIAIVRASHHPYTSTLNGSLGIQNSS